MSSYEVARVVGADGTIAGIEASGLAEGRESVDLPAGRTLPPTADQEHFESRRGQRKEKLSITIDADLVAQIRIQAGEGGVSEWISGAARLRLQATMVDQIIATHGVVLSPELLAEVEAEWPIGD